MLLTKLAKKRLKESKKNECLADYELDPIAFIHEVLGVKYLSPDQVKLALSVRDNRETYCQSAHGQGKTAISAWLLLWWVFAVQGLCVSSGPTARQVKELLWGEVRKIYDVNKHKLGGERGQTFLRVTESSRAFGFASLAYDSNSFQGLHSDRLLIILDEACGISQEVWDGASSCVTGANNRFLAIGNPVLSGTPFQKACAQGNIRIPAWNHPNVSWGYQICEDGIHRLKPEVSNAILNEKGEVLPQSEWALWCSRDLIPGAISISWIEKARREKGESSAFWQGRVEGLFPTDAESSITPRTWFLAARARYDANPAYWDNLASPHQWRHALDVGDGGDDHALASWKGPVLYSVKAIPTKGDRMDVTRASGIAIKVLSDRPGIMAVDRIGVGAGALAILKEKELNCLGTEWGSAASDNVQFLNAKAEQHWFFREGLQNEEVAIAPLGEYEEYAMEDLALTYYEYTSSGKVRIEDKAKTRKRLHRSPNCGDAIVMAYNCSLGMDWGDAVVVGSKRIGTTLDW